MASGAGAKATGGDGAADVALLRSELAAVEALVAEQQQTLALLRSEGELRTGRVEEVRALLRGPKCGPKCGAPNAAHW